MRTVSASAALGARVNVGREIGGRGPVIARLEMHHPPVAMLLRPVGQHCHQRPYGGNAALVFLPFPVNSLQVAENAGQDFPGRYGFQVVGFQPGAFAGRLPQQGQAFLAVEQPAAVESVHKKVAFVLVPDEKMPRHSNAQHGNAGAPALLPCTAATA